MPSRELKKDREASRARGGAAYANQYHQGYRASEGFDWDDAIARFKKTLIEVYGEGGDDE